MFSNSDCVRLAHIMRLKRLQICVETSFAQIFPDLNLKHMDARYAVVGVTNTDLEKPPAMRIGEVNTFFIRRNDRSMCLLRTSSFLWLRTVRNAFSF